MNKKIISIMIFLSMLMPVVQCSTQVNSGWKQKVNNVVSAVCAKMPSKKKCLIIASAITSVAVTIGVLWKYTNVFSLICSKTGAESSPENVAIDDVDETTKDKKLRGQPEVKQEIKSDDDEQPPVNKEEKTNKKEEVEGFSGEGKIRKALSWIAEKFDNQVI